MVTWGVAAHSSTQFGRSFVAKTSLPSLSRWLMILRGCIRPCRMQTTCRLVMKPAAASMATLFMPHSFAVTHSFKRDLTACWQTRKPTCARGGGGWGE